jgi:hypothetical protein
MPAASAVIAVGATRLDAASSAILMGNAISPAATSAMLIGADNVAGASGVGDDINKSYELFNLF